MSDSKPEAPVSRVQNPWRAPAHDAYGIIVGNDGLIVTGPDEELFGCDEEDGISLIVSRLNALDADLARERERADKAELDHSLLVDDYNQLLISLGREREQTQLWLQQAEEANVALKAERVLREAAEAKVVVWEERAALPLARPC